MRVERLISEGGVKIYNDANRLLIDRIAQAGETRISFVGLDFEYDAAGNLIYATLRTAEYLAAQKKWLALAPDEFRQLLDFLKASGREIIVRVDLVSESVVVVRQNVDGQLEECPSRTLAQVEAKPLGVTLEINGMDIGLMAIVVRRKGGKLVIGAGAGDPRAGAVVFRQALRVNYHYLEGDLVGEAGLAKLKCFINGEGLAKNEGDN